MISSKALCYLCDNTTLEGFGPEGHTLANQYGFVATYEDDSELVLRDGTLTAYSDDGVALLERELPRNDLPNLR